MKVWFAWNCVSYPKPGKPPEEWSINDVDGIYDYYDTEIDLINVKEVEPPVNLRDARIKLGLSKIGDLTLWA